MLAAVRAAVSIHVCTQRYCTTCGMPHVLCEWNHPGRDVGKEVVPAFSQLACAASSSTGVVRVSLEPLLWGRACDCRGLAVGKQGCSHG